MKVVNKFKVSICAALVSGLIGCAANVNPEYDLKIKQSLSEISAWKVGDNAANLAPLKITELIDIEELHHLIEQAMGTNPSLKQAVIALEMVKEQNEQAWASLYPDADLYLGAEKEEGTSKEFTSELSISWELDIWNKVGDGIAGAEELIKSEQATLESVKNVLAADIMRQWITISANQQYVEIESKRLEALMKNKEFIQERYVMGLGDLEDLDTAMTSIASSQASVEEYKETLLASKRALSVLIGNLGISDSISIPSEFPSVITPITSLPEQDLSNRPDLKEAYANLKVDQYSENVAYKDMLPSISLSASLSGSSSSPIDSLLKDPLWNLLGNISAPLFRGGELKSEAEIATMTVQQSYWTYQETLLDAVTEVQDSLGQELSLSKQEKYLNDAYTSSQRSESNYQNKYESGLVEILDLLSAQQTTYDAQIELVQAKYERLTNRIDLGLALGLGV